MLGSKDIGIIKSELVAKTQFLYGILLVRLCDRVAPLALALIMILNRGNVFASLVPNQFRPSLSG